MGNIKHTPSLGRIIDGIYERLGRLERTSPYPRYTTANLPDATLLKGTIVYDTTANKLKASDGSSWNALW